jgi:hypothetical protein
LLPEFPGAKGMGMFTTFFTRCVRVCVFVATTSIENGSLNWNRIKNPKEKTNKKKQCSSN